MEEFENHLKIHSGDPPRLQKWQYEIYDIQYILYFILNQQQSVDRVAGYALDFVGVRARELGKVEWLNDFWGHPGKRAWCISATASAPEASHRSAWPPYYPYPTYRPDPPFVHFEYLHQNGPN